MTCKSIVAISDRSTSIIPVVTPAWRIIWQGYVAEHWGGRYRLGWFNQVRISSNDCIVGWALENHGRTIGRDTGELFQFVVVSKDSFQLRLVNIEWEWNNIPPIGCKWTILHGHIHLFVHVRRQIEVGVCDIIFKFTNSISSCRKACELLLYVVDAGAQPLFQLVYIGLVVSKTNMPEGSWLLWVTPSLIILYNCLGNNFRHLVDFFKQMVFNASAN